MSAGPDAVEPCPCGGGAYADCCRPLHHGGRRAETAEELMRSRYSAFAHGEWNYLWQTWHPRTRPAGVDPSPLVWEGLEIVDTEDGCASDDEGVVEFIARYRQGNERGVLHERSRFAKRAGRWFYLDGEIN